MYKIGKLRAYYMAYCDLDTTVRNREHIDIIHRTKYAVFFEIGPDPVAG